MIPATIDWSGTFERCNKCLNGKEASMKANVNPEFAASETLVEKSGTG